MLPCDPRWCHVFPGGARCFQVFPGGARCFQVFPGGAKTGGTKRTMFMYAGMWSVVYKVGIRVMYHR